MASPIITMPDVPSLGLPAGEKDAGQRVDFKPSKFDLLIENKGYLLAWTRACVCPCVPVSSKSDQPDPNCSVCKGSGWFYFGGSVAQDLSEYRFDDVQQKIVTDSGAMLIRGILSGIAGQYDTLDRLSNWQSGAMSLTVRHQNKLGLYDKIVVLDPDITHSETVVADGSSVLNARYPITGVNQAWGHVPDAAAPVAYVVGLDYERNSMGQLEWLPGRAPIENTRVAIHYLCHPTFLVVEHPHIVRSTLKKFKTAPAMLKSPLGDNTPLPVQAIVKYEFLL